MTVALKQISYFVPAPDDKSADNRYLGPARVRMVAGNRVLLEIPDEQVWALLAIGYPYQSVPGDTVLAIGQEGNWYVIGVLKGTGKTTFTAPGDIEFRAPRGSIDLTSAKGLRIRSHRVRIVSDEIELVARTISEKFDSARRWVKEAFQLRAGRVRTIVDSTYRVKAKRIVERAEGDVKIDGKKIHLG